MLKQKTPISGCLDNTSGAWIPAFCAARTSHIKIRTCGVVHPNS